MADSKSLKRSKLSSTSDEDSVIDRISDLPDCLLSSILSFLPTKYAVRTSILSTRWKFVWTYITNLHFNDGFRQKNEEVHNREMFDHFVYVVLSLLKQRSLRKFSLTCRQFGPAGYIHVNNWICTAIERVVEELSLVVPCYGSASLEQPLPCSTLFNSKTLKALTLNGSWKISLSKYSVSFPSLKKLALVSVRYEDNESVHKLLCGCPVLEDLLVGRHLPDGASNFNISSSSLIRLHIDFEDTTLRGFVLEINTPALKYLYLLDHMSSEISLKNMVSLVEAEIDAFVWGIPGEDGNNVMLQLVNGLSNAKSIFIESNNAGSWLRI